VEGAVDGGDVEEEQATKLGDDDEGVEGAVDGGDVEEQATKLGDDEDEDE
jgi:hypothetical protein